MSEEDLGRYLIEVGLSLVEPLEAIANEPDAVLALLELAGWDLSAVLGFGTGELAEAVRKLSVATSSVRALLDAEAGDGIDIITVGRALATVGDAIAGLASLAEEWRAPEGLPSDLPAVLIEDLLGQLLVLYLGDHHPASRAGLEFLGVLTYQTSPPITTLGGVVVRSGMRRPSVDFPVLGRLCTDPGEVLRNRLGLGMARRPAADVADDVFPSVAALLREAGLTAWYGDPGGDGQLSADELELLSHLLRIVWVHAEEGGPIAKLDLALALRDEGVNRALLVHPTGSLEYSVDEGAWNARAALTGTVSAVVVRKDGVEFAATGNPELHLTASLEYPPGTAPLVRLGSSEGIRFDVVSGKAEAHVVLTPDDADVGVETVVKGRLVAGAPEGDGFLAEVIPAPGLDVEFEINASWTRRDGLRLGGSPGLRTTIAKNVQLGPAKITTAHLAVEPTADGLAALAALDADMQLGPLSAVVVELGLRARLVAAPRGGNLGVANMSVTVAPPRGVALSIDAGTVSGGGFLSFDADKKQYAGGVHLEFEGIGLSAFGLLSTRMPDGSPGFSLLILVQVSGFAPIQLGFGFTLTGVGGLLGVNRTVDVEVLQTGLRNRTLDAILFSQEDPTPRAPQIVSTLQSVFPPAPDQYVFGPMVQITWGPPPDPVLTIEVALVLVLPAPLRLVILGRVQASLPTPDHPVVKLRLDVVGVIDFDRRHLAIDATLHDSFIGPFALTGDMAARGSWGDQPDFAVALGGFHPAFRPPEGFPQLRRLALTLSSGDNPRLRMEAYLALTSNTVQIGARLDFYAAAAGFSLEGGFGFDTLINLSSFRLQAQIDAGLTLKRGGTTLAHLGVHVNLVGPSPWEVWGTATISLLSLDISVPFNATFGEPQAIPEPERVDVWALFKGQLAHPANWSTQLPPEDNRLVILMALPGQGDALVHPLGAVSVTQRLVPLERTLSLFGTAPPAEANFFGITGSTELVRGDDVYDYFAPAQFRRMSDAEKLSSPSFDRMVSGATFGPRLDDVTIGTVAVAPLDYETALVVDLEDPTRLRSEAYRPPGDTVATVAGRGPAALAEMRDQGRDKFAPPAPGPTLAEPEYVVATQDTLAEGVDGHDGTYSGAVEALRLRPDAERFQIVRREEVELAAL